MKSYGFIPSQISKDTVRFVPSKSMPIPKRYSYRPFLTPVTNQGYNPYCIPHSIACWINWREGMRTGIRTDIHVRYDDIFRSKKTKNGDGMTYQDAFEYLRTKGVRTDKGTVRISCAGFIPNEGLLKAAILANGPCFGALPVYNPEAAMFWRNNGGRTQGWHSVTIVGWDETGYIIRNSWGVSFADRGYTVIPYSDVYRFRELWTILG